ncbi:MAG: 5'/3'-nucleotidase SurE [Treponema sp.]|jgi:5'-nucleotidase|nr:5'/3'-nucleotidase SurE [Treponema sp.]
MNIFLTNDDGIDSEAFLDFAEALRKGTDHRIFVIAPDSNRSGVSHALTCLHKALSLRPRGKDTWSCSGSPADCASVATMGGLGDLSGQAPFKPDLVLAGINAGANLGTDLIFSGTAAAARHAALYGIPSVALSLAGHQRDFHWGNAIAYSLEHLEELAALWREDIFVNVNIPNTVEGPQGMVITFPSLRQYTDSITIHEGAEGISCTLQWGDILTEAEEGSDWDAVSRNQVSVSPVFIHPVVRRDLCAGAPDHTGAGKRPNPGKRT